MWKSLLVGTLLLGLAVDVAISAASTDGKSDNPEDAAGDSSNSNKCGLYLAISSTSTVDETNWGLFAGRDIPKDTSIASPEVSIVIPHLRANNYPVRYDQKSDAEKQQHEQGFMSQMVDFFENFFWTAETGAAQFESTNGRLLAAIPGAGVLTGYSPKKTNTDWNVTSAYLRPLMGEQTGVPHPERGAISPFYNAQVVSTADIKAGSELFMEFGENWGGEGGEEDENDLVLKDYTHIDLMVDQMIEFFKKHEDSLDEDTKLELYTFLLKDVMKAAVGAAKSRRVQQLLPPHPDHLHKIREAGGARLYSDPAVYRTPEWLDKYGLCMDNLRVGPSTIPNAGRGAFATRPVAAGQLVAPVPLAQVPERAVLDMHRLTTVHDSGGGGGDYHVPESDEVVSQQLFLNYCYGHPESSMVFFPAGAMASMINHSDKPNAKIVWSTHANHQKTWFDLEPRELLDEDHMFLGLMFEIVATRDIAADEEVFIDYGPEWKAAHAKHVQEWNAKIAAGEIPKEWPLRAVDLNHQFRSQPFRTAAEAAQEPYPENVQLKAFLLLQDTNNAGTVADPKLWADDDEEVAYDHNYLFDVTVLDRTPPSAANDNSISGYTYKVEWRDEGLGKATIVAGVPHAALVFFDKPGTSDQYTEHAFRHHIGIPDEIFPQGPWRNLPK